MGKPKGKGPRAADGEIRHDISIEAIPASRPKSPLKAADGHNVDGWADEDIRTYNELLIEREKLEKEKNELEQKSSRHQTQRALLDENATALDSLFKSQLGGDFKFTGSGKCCLDFDVTCGKDDFPCKHEICTRAKSKGVSWMEIDTIKYYHARILSEKTQRMQSALRKQRDVELVRVKKDDEEEAALRARKNAILDKATRSTQAPIAKPKADKANKLDTATLDMLPLASKDFLLDPKNSAILEAAKGNEHIVRRIRGRLDKIRHDVNAGRVSPADARVRLDQANSEMAEAERKNNEFRQMILDAEPTLSQLPQPAAPSSGTNTTTSANLTTALQNTLASTNADAFSQALTIMKGFFSASDPHDVQTAITDLRSVLELNGPMSPVLQKSFRALENMLAKPNAKGFTVDVTTSDGKTRTCSNVVEIMMNLRMKMRGSDSPSDAVDPNLNLDEDTVKANLECIKVEDAAKKDMTKIADRMAEDTVENISAVLKKLKAKAILKSPIPPLSDIVLDDVITDLLLRRSIKALVVEAAAGASLAQLSGKLTSLIITTARNKPEKYLAILRSAKDCIDKTSEKRPQVLLEAMSKVEASMSKFVAAHEEKLKKSSAAAVPTFSTPLPVPVPASNSPKPMIETRYLLEGTLFDPVEYQGLVNFLNTPSSTDATKLRSRVYEYYHRNLEEGVWDLLRAVLINETSNHFFWADFEQQKSFCIENLQLLAAAPEMKLTDTVAYLQELGVCPGRAAILIGQRMALQIRENYEVTKERIIDLKTLFKDSESGDNKDWIRSFNFIARTMTDTFGMLTLTLVGEDPIDVPIMAADILGFMCTFVLGSMDDSRAATNRQWIEWFVLHVLLGIDRRDENYKKLEDVFFQFDLMCQDSSRFRCSPEHNCQAKFRTFAKEKLSSLFPAPLTMKKEELRPEDDPSSLSFQTSSGLPRESHLQLLVATYWDVAKCLMPHLQCIATNNKKCGCSQLDKEFGDEIQVLKNSIDLGFVQISTFIVEGKTPPKAIWDTLERSALLLHERPATWPGNQKRLKELREQVGTLRFQELFAPELEILGPPPSLPAPTEPDTATNARSRSISLKQVPVSNPSIQNSMSSNASEKGNLEKGAAEASSSKKTAMTEEKLDTSSMATEKIDASATAIEKDPHITDNRSASPAASLSTSEDENPFPMTARELEIRDQLLKFTDSVDSMHSVQDGETLQVAKSALDGVAWQIEDMLIGHVEMVYLIAKAQGYGGLKAWIEYYYKNTMPVPLDDKFTVRR